ncbi:DUF2642 domain-containing protein [Bacillus sp. BRMEA1]|uniref:DUF2642 domain-containing protein n=1 Tax=Neobacillus endophyticus TaxID=2738405 RepID=UPI001565247D|nr:DUF2642 domain-containing protein [Neobacillus endophyticus]NRD79530.1 DUF2642 domain-containing protein [Neobacillus endophyticus]
MSVDQFKSTLNSLIGFNVSLYVGEQVYKGKLISVEPDHVIIENENNYIFYYNISQIQAITKNTKQFQGEEITSEYLKTQSLKQVLDSLTNSWVTIFCTSKQKFSGILSKVGADFITLINGADGILIQNSNIANVIKGEMKEQENSETKEENNQSEAKNEQLSYASPVMTVEDEFIDQNNEIIMVNDPESKQEVSINQDNELKKAGWSQPINIPAEQPKEAAASKSASQVASKEERIEKRIEKRKVERKEELKVERNEELNEELKEVHKEVLKEALKEEPKRVLKDEPVLLAEDVKVEVQPEAPIKFIKEELKQPVRVWSQPIKNANSKLNESVTKKMENEIKKMREEQAQINKKQEKKKEKEKAVNTTKKEDTQKLSKEVKSVQKLEIAKTVNKTQEPSIEKKNENLPVEQPIRTFRFLGEPIPTKENSRPSIFDGWFSRNSDSRL